MSQQSTLIYELKGLKKTYNDQTVLNIGRLQFHRGTIYGVVGPIGSGKSTLLKIMAGLKKESDGTLKYDMNQFKTNWLGKIIPTPEIQYYNSNINNKNLKVLNFINAQGFASISFFKKAKKNGPKIN
jgi:ABC-type multidrug transport system ATPase subunit